MTEELRRRVADLGAAGQRLKAKIRFPPIDPIIPNSRILNTYSKSIRGVIAKSFHDMKTEVICETLATKYQVRLDPTASDYELIEGPLRYIYNKHKDSRFWMTINVACIMKRYNEETRALGGEQHRYGRH